MEELPSFIFKNLFLILLAVFALISFIFHHKSRNRELFEVSGDQAALVLHPYHVPEELRESDKAKNFLAGIEATQRELDKVFNSNGITRIAAKGMPLDPNQHQAMMEIPTDEAEPGTIVQEMQAGYMIKDRLLRPAMVGVAKKPD
mgnify:CR=1 FL=1